MDRWAWQSTVHRVAKSWTLLKWLSMLAFTMNEIVHFSAFSYASFIFTPYNHHTAKTYWTSTMGQVLHTDNRIFRTVISLQMKMLRLWTAYHDHKGSRGYVAVENVNTVSSLKASGLLFFLKKCIFCFRNTNFLNVYLITHLWNKKNNKSNLYETIHCSLELRAPLQTWLPKMNHYFSLSYFFCKKIIKPKGILYSLRS